jgi:hypothetical protein
MLDNTIQKQKINTPNYLNQTRTIVSLVKYSELCMLVQKQVIAANPPSFLVKPSFRSDREFKNRKRFRITTICFSTALAQPPSRD